MSLEFIRLYQEVADITLLTPDRCWWLWVNARKTALLPGEMVECGTFKGGSAKLIYKAVHGQKFLHLFDTFTGIPASQRGDDDHQAGEFACDIAMVKEALVGCDRVNCYPGLVPSTLSAVRSREFCFVHLDMDLYRPIYDALHFFWKRMVMGGIIMVDDFDHLKGVTDAVKEFRSDIFNSHPRQKPVKMVRTTLMQVMIVKE